MKKIYLIGSLRNPKIPELASKIRGLQYKVFDDWYAAGPEADDIWMAYEKNRGRTYVESLNSIFAEHVFDFDYWHLMEADIGVLVMPAGKSGHLELGFLCGRQKPTYVLFDKEPERYDFMYRFCTDVFMNEDDLLLKLKEL